MWTLQCDVELKRMSIRNSNDWEILNRNHETAEIRQINIQDSHIRIRRNDWTLSWMYQRTCRRKTSDWISAKIYQEIYFINTNAQNENSRNQDWFVDSLRIQQQKARWNTNQSSCEFYQRILIHTADCDWQKQHRDNLTLKTWMSEKAMIENCSLCESWNTIRRTSEEIENSRQ